MFSLTLLDHLHLTFTQVADRHKAHTTAAASYAGAALIVLLVNLTFDFETSAHAHAACSTHLWSIRERYGSLLSDLREGALDLQEARYRRDQLMEELRAMYEKTAVAPLGEIVPPQPQQVNAPAA